MTNGVVSLVDKDGRVLIKVVVGCDGYNAVGLAEALRDAPGSLSIPSIQHLAHVNEFGCLDCRVVQWPGGAHIATGEELHPRYAERFEDPRFNPRWENGSAAHVEVVVVDWPSTPTPGGER